MLLSLLDDILFYPICVVAKPIILALFICVLSFSSIYIFLFYTFDFVNSLFVPCPIRTLYITSLPWSIDSYQAPIM